MAFTDARGKWHRYMLSYCLSLRHGNNNSSTIWWLKFYIFDDGSYCRNAINEYTTGKRYRQRETLEMTRLDAHVEMKCVFVMGSAVVWCVVSMTILIFYYASVFGMNILKNTSVVLTVLYGCHSSRSCLFDDWLHITLTRAINVKHALVLWWRCEKIKGQIKY